MPKAYIHVSDKGGVKAILATNKSGIRKTKGFEFMKETSENHNNKQCINRIPTELLSRIFMCCKDGDWINHQTVVTTVCRNWRNVALNTPTLWTEIVGFDCNNEPHRFAPLCLARAGSTAPLDIKIILQSHKTPQSTWSPSAEILIERARNFYEFLHSNGATVSRWRSLHLETNIFGVLLCTIKITQSCPMACLKSIDLGFRNVWIEPGGVTYKEPNDLPPEPLFMDPLPSQLHTAKLLGVPFRYLFGNASHPRFAGLRCLELELFGTQVDLRRLSTILDASPRLVELSLSIGRNSVSARRSLQRILPQRIPKVHLAHLQKLCVPHSSSTLAVKNILGLIDAPFLRTLELYTTALYISEKLNELLGCFMGSSESSSRFPLLSSFSCGSDPGGSEDVEQVLALCPKLTVLRLRSGPWLNTPLSLAHLLPYLTDLSVSRLESLEKLRRVVTVWKEAGVPLARVVVDVEPGLGWEIYKLSPHTEAELEAIRKIVDLEVFGASGGSS